MNDSDTGRAASRRPLVRVDGVGIRHDGRTAFTPDGVTFDVHPGEVVLLLGPSGSGKSTLALALNGLVPHAIPATLRGEVIVGGEHTTDSTVAQLSERVAMVFQDPDAQIVTGTVLDEVSFGPENLRLGVAEVLERAERALREVGLWERRSENPDRLSGGGRQRLAIACALALSSPVIVLDEPTANLDPAGTDEVYAVLRDLVADGEHSIVLIEHNLDAAIDIVDRVVVIDRQGRLRFDGATRDVLLGHTEELIEAGVWLPVATLAAIQLRATGIPIEPLPLTLAELSESLDRIDRLPEPSPRPGIPDSTAAPAIEVRGLSVSKHRTGILHDIDLNIPEGAYVAIVGTNGAGKTTLLQAIAGVARPPTGRIRMHGLDPARADARTLARSIGFVFQNPEHQFIRNTVGEELAHGPELLGLDPATVSARVDELLERFGLAEVRDIHPFLLSGGQKRRLSVGTALIDGAPVLALDEPTFGQDRERARELLGLLRELNESGTTVLVVTHDLQLVADFASHILVLSGGRVAGFGPAGEILASDLLESAGLRVPPLARAMRALTRHPHWHGVARLADLPAGVVS